MPLHYLDTSAAVPLFVREAATDRVRTFLKGLPDGEIAISPWVVTEFASALGLKHRMGAIDNETLAGAFARWTVFTRSLRLLDIARSDFDEAERLCRRGDLAVRAGDALHLAVAAAKGCTLVTLDERLAASAPATGVPVAVI